MLCSVNTVTLNSLQSFFANCTCQAPKDSL
jgi:hypothetical protein